MLSDRGRALLFWFTVSMILLVAAVAVIAILRACNSVISPREPTPAISPSEITLCPGEQHQFGVEGDVEVTWEATGGEISAGGVFIASDTVGDYTITALGRNSREAATASVHIVACTAESALPAPTSTPTTTATPTLAPPPVSIPTPTSAPGTAGFSPTDPQDDVGTYDTGDPVASPPAGIDIRTASVGAGLRVALQPTENVPEELSDWATSDDVLLWLSLYEPIPDPPGGYSDWLFALDVDGDMETGRPAGSARINPDLGTEAAIGVRYDHISGEYVPYFLAWDPTQGNWTEYLDVTRFRLSESRTLIGLALPLETLTQTVAQVTGVTLAPDTVKGRAAALATEEQTVIDFYPERPD